MNFKCYIKGTPVDSFDFEWLESTKTTRDVNSITLLYAAAITNNFELTYQLSILGHDLTMCSRPDFDGSRPIHAAAEKGHTNIVQYLLQHWDDIKFAHQATVFFSK